MYTRSETLSRIATRCGVTREADQEQIIDILLGRAELGKNKYETFIKTTEDWSPNEWRSLLREFYVSFSGSKLPRLLYYELGFGGDVEVAVSAQREITPVKSAPDPYYNYLVNMEYLQPTPKSCREHLTEILLSVYVAISSGENYGTVVYPPRAFIEKVVNIDITQEEFMGAVLNSMCTFESFEKKVCELSKQHPETVSNMRTAYKELVGLGIKNTVDNIKQKSAVAATVASVKAEKLARKIKANSYEEDVKSTRNHKHKKRKVSKAPKTNLLCMGILTRLEFLSYSVLACVIRVLLLKGQPFSLSLVFEVILCCISIVTAVCILLAIPRNSRFLRLILVGINIIVNIVLTLHILRAIYTLLSSFVKGRMRKLKWFMPKLPKIK